MSNEIVAEWEMRNDSCTLWFKCSNCNTTALQDENCNDILTDECPFCGAKMKNGHRKLSEVIEQEKKRKLCKKMQKMRENNTANYEVRDDQVFCNYTDTYIKNPAMIMLKGIGRPHRIGEYDDIFQEFCEMQKSASDNDLVKIIGKEFQLVILCPVDDRNNFFPQYTRREVLSAQEACTLFNYLQSTECKWSMVSDASNGIKDFVKNIGNRNIY